MKPTKQQELILNYDDSCVVIAAPGSGKTFVVSQKIKKNLKLLLDHQGVIAISYTNKASLELKNRSLSNGEDPKCSFFGTIDKFYLSEIVVPFGKLLFGIPTDEISILTADTLTEPEQEGLEWLGTRPSLEKLSKEELKMLIDFFGKGVILIESVGILADYIFSHSMSCRNYIKARYKHLYIDEYQDAGNEQHQLFIKIKDLGIVAVAVGDLNQSIYKFSGKDSKFLQALTTNANFKTFKLDKNHRCHASIINYSNYFLNQQTALIETEQNLVFLGRVAGSEKEVAKWIDDKISIVQENFFIDSLGQFAVLTRGSRTAAIINTNMQTPHYLAIQNELDTNLNIWSSIFSNLLHFTLNKKIRFIDVIEVFTSYDRYSRKQLEELDVCKRRLENAKYPLIFDRKTITADFIKVATLVAPLSENVDSLKLLDNVFDDPEQIKSYVSSGDNQVTIMTLHKSKGLEFDFVFHLDLCEWVFPNKQPGDGGDFNNPKYGDYTQDANLHYVGVTRARKGCWLVTSTQRTAANGQIRNAKDSEFLWIPGIDKLRYQKEK